MAPKSNRTPDPHRPHSTITPPTDPQPSAPRTRTNWMAQSSERISHNIMGKCSCNTPNRTLSSSTRMWTTANLTPSEHYVTTPTISGRTETKSSTNMLTPSSKASTFSRIQKYDTIMRIQTFFHPEIATIARVRLSKTY
jgi:hypothetical protein